MALESPPCTESKMSSVSFNSRLCSLTSEPISIVSDLSAPICEGKKHIEYIRRRRWTEDSREYSLSVRVLHLASYMSHWQVTMSYLFAHLLLLFSVLFLEVLVALHPRCPSPGVHGVPRPRSRARPVWAVCPIRHPSPSRRSRLGRFLSFEIFVVISSTSHKVVVARHACLRNVSFYSRNLCFPT